MKPSVYSINDLEGIIRKNKRDVQQILSEMNGENSLPSACADADRLVYETRTTRDISYAGTMVLAKQKGITVEVVLVKKMSARFVSLAKARNPKTKITQFGAASYPITIRFTDEVIRHIVERLAFRNAIKKTIPLTEVLTFIYKLTNCH